MPPTAIVLAAFVLATAGCTPGPSGAPGPPVRHVDIARLPELPLHDLEAPPPDLAASPAVDLADPVAVATGHIRAGLTAEGLEVVDLDGDQTAAAGGRVSVGVVATHRTGPAGQPHTSVYELDLARQPEGSWAVVGSQGDE